MFLKIRFLLFAPAIITCIFLISPVMGEVPTAMNYQGVLKDSSGDPVADGDYSITFTIYDAEIGGTSKWTEAQIVSVYQGAFSVLLGAINPILDTVFSDSIRYLGIGVELDAEISPRTKLVSTPFAHRTATIDGASGGTLTGSVVWSSDLNDDDKPMMYLFDPQPASPTTRWIAVRSPSDPYLGLRYNTTNEGFEFSFGSAVMSILMTSQRVGIGTDSPQSELDVVGTLRASGVALGYQPTRSGNNSTVGGGSLNTASANWATAAGGFQNTASGQNSVTPGGELNVAAGNYSYAAGRRAKANHLGAFVWGDATNADVTSAVDNSFVTRASGGYSLYSDASLTTGVQLTPGSGSWSSLSDKNAKNNIQPINGEDILDKLAELEISRWSYKAEGQSIEHIGPMAQDFYRIFQVGGDDKTITTVDADGIAFAAIKALYEQNIKLAKEVEELRALLGNED